MAEERTDLTYKVVLFQVDEVIVRGVDHADIDGDNVLYFYDEAGDMLAAFTQWLYMQEVRDV